MILSYVHVSITLSLITWAVVVPDLSIDSVTQLPTRCRRPRVWKPTVDRGWLIETNLSIVLSFWLTFDIFLSYGLPGTGCSSCLPYHCPKFLFTMALCSNRFYCTVLSCCYIGIVLSLSHPDLSGCITTLVVGNTEDANFCAAMDTLIDQDEFKLTLKLLSEF